MAKKGDYYEVYDYGDNLHPGDRLKIEHHISCRDDGTRLAQWTHLPAGELEALREKSAASERAVFEKLCGAVSEWEEIAAHTQLLERAIEYVKIPPSKHTSNEWMPDEYNHFECSNMVYKMTYRISEDKSYGRGKGETIAWDLSWAVYTNAPEVPGYYRNNEKIAGQDRKRFSTKEEMDKYMIGRITAHGHLFTEISPPIPQEYAKAFCCSGQLLPGYTIAAPPVLEVTEPAKEDDGGTDYSKFIRKKPHKDGPAKKAGPVR